MALYSLRRKSVNRNEREGVKEKNGHSVDLKEKQIIIFLLIKFHIGMAWMPRMLSNLHHSYYNNALNHGVWISSCLVLYKLHHRLLGGKHYTCHIRAFDRLMKTSFIHSYSSSKTQHNTAKQIDSNSTKKPKYVLFWGSKPNKRARINNFFSLYAQLLINFPAGQVGRWGGRGSLTDEKQCALFHYTVNPISCFTLCRRVAERGNEWDGMGKCWHNPKIPKATPVGHWGTVEGFWAINQSIRGLMGPHVAIMVIHVSLKWEACTWLDKVRLFIHFVAYSNQEVTLGKSVPFLREHFQVYN